MSLLSSRTSEVSLLSSAISSFVISSDEVSLPVFPAGSSGASVTLRVSTSDPTTGTSFSGCISSAEAAGFSPAEAAESSSSHFTPDEMR